MTASQLKRDFIAIIFVFNSVNTIMQTKVSFSCDPQIVNWVKLMFSSSYVLLST